MASKELSNKGSNIILLKYAFKDLSRVWKDKHIEIIYQVDLSLLWSVQCKWHIYKRQADAQMKKEKNASWTTLQKLLKARPEFFWRLRELSSWEIENFAGTSDGEAKVLLFTQRPTKIVFWCVLMSNEKEKYFRRISKNFASASDGEAWVLFET